MNRVVVGFCFFLDTFTFLIKIWDRARSTQTLTQTQTQIQIQIRCRCRLWAATGFCLRQRTWIWIRIRIRMGMGIRIVWHDSPWTARGCPNLKLVHEMYLNISLTTFRLNLLYAEASSTSKYNCEVSIGMIDWCSIHFEINAVCRFLLCTIVLLVFHLFTAIQWHQVYPMAISTHRILPWFAPQLLVASAKKCKHTHTHTSYLPFSHTHTHTRRQRRISTSCCSFRLCPELVFESQPTAAN